MPLYDFKCPICEHSVELLTKHDATVPCAKCGADMQRQVSIPAAPVFKGTGFYQTDFKGQP